ncbi:MAG: hypothetical protein ACM3S0_17940 [Acidobacteriota bacterium]
MLYKLLMDTRCARQRKIAMGTLWVKTAVGFFTIAKYPEIA